jgi:hypothetical protein
MSRHSGLRILFLDDDKRRAADFALQWPEATWVQTVEECINLLDLEWDVIWLDHDLGGERWVDSERNDCGMEAVRHIVSDRLDHLRRTIFIVHTHNVRAGQLMRDTLVSAGYDCTYQPYKPAEPGKGVTS